MSRSAVIVEYVGFFFTFASFNTVANFASHAMHLDDFNSLGFISNGIVYLVFAVVSLFSSAIINKIGLKLAHILGSTCYLVYAIAFLAPAFYHIEKKSFPLSREVITGIIYLGAAICGVGAGIIWPA